MGGGGGGMLLIVASVGEVTRASGHATGLIVAQGV
jgi:hypothetical protein